MFSIVSNGTDYTLSRSTGVILRVVVAMADHRSNSSVGLSRYGDNLCAETWNKMRLHDPRNALGRNPSETKTIISSILIDRAVDLVLPLDLF